MALQPSEEAIEAVMGVTSINRNEAIYRLKVYLSSLSTRQRRSQRASRREGKC
jgi:hypothetical protein